MADRRASKVVRGGGVSAVGKSPQAFSTGDLQRTRAIVGQVLGYVNFCVSPPSPTCLLAIGGFPAIELDCNKKYNNG